MKENLKTILIIASIALNVVFTGTYLAYKLPALMAGHSATSRGPVYLYLGLTAEQMKGFEAEHEKMQTQLQETSKEIRARQSELVDLLAQTPPVPQAVEAKQKEIQNLQKAVQGRIISHLLQASGHLAPEQRTRFFQLVKERIDMGGQACPAWIRPPEEAKRCEESK